MSRWQIYSMLKGCNIPDNIEQVIKQTSIEELREGIIEYLLMIKKNSTDNTI